MAMQFPDIIEVLNQLDAIKEVLVTAREEKEQLTRKRNELLVEANEQGYTDRQILEGVHNRIPRSVMSNARSQVRLMRKLKGLN